MSFADFKIHPVAGIFPMIAHGSRQWNNLVEDIATNGQIEPTVWDGDVLIDGRNRELACEQLGIAPKRVQWSTLGVKIPVGEWIMGKNVARRQLTPDQVATVYAEYNALVKRLRAEKAKEATQFKEGISPNPGGKPKAEVNPKSGSPEKTPKRDIAEMHARSTAGQVAQEAGVSRHKAEQAVALTTAAQTNPEAKAALEEVKAGKVKLAEAVKTVKPKPAKKAAQDKSLLDQFKAAAGRIWDKCAAADRDAFRINLHKAIDDLE